MRWRLSLASSALGLASLFVISFAALSGRAAIDAGWSLLTTADTSSTFDGYNWTGVPLGTFDFGHGAVSVGAVDTIILRENTITVSGGSSALLPVALQLESVQTVDPAGDHLFATLHSSQLSGSSMTANWNAPNTPTTFSDHLLVSFDVRLGSLTVPIIMPHQLLDMSVTSQPWSHVPTGNAPLINGVDYLLNGVDTSADFWPGGPGGQLVHNTGNGHHVVYVFGDNAPDYDVNDPDYTAPPVDNIPPPDGIDVVPEAATAVPALLATVGVLGATLCRGLRHRKP